MSRQVSRGSAGEYQADEQAGVTRLSWRVSGQHKENKKAMELDLNSNPDLSELII